MLPITVQFDRFTRRRRYSKSVSQALADCASEEHLSNFQQSAKYTRMSVGSHTESFCEH